MMTTRNTKPPEIPFFVAKPLSLLPKRIARLPTEHALNHMFAAELGDGDLDFLSNRVVTVNIDDMSLRFSLTLVENRLRVLRAPRDVDLKISGTAYAFLQLATRGEDTDTLFFRRHLRTSGDTELGLYVKNLLDSMDLDTMPLQPALGRCLRLFLRTADATDAVRSRVSRLFAGRAA
jgi:predicted lipid carrier protein YhbT